MAALGAVVLRQRLCLSSECRTLFFLCSRCDRGQRYCSRFCRDQARCRQRQYRRHRAQARVTDQGSLSISRPALSEGGPVEATPLEDPDRSGGALLPGRPETRPGVWLCCRAGGRRSLPAVGVRNETIRNGLPARRRDRGFERSSSCPGRCGRPRLSAVRSTDALSRSARYAITVVAIWSPQDQSLARKLHEQGPVAPKPGKATSEPTKATRSRFNVGSRSTVRFRPAPLRRMR
jgi:hypothetical protein